MRNASKQHITRLVIAASAAALCCFPEKEANPALEFSSWYAAMFLWSSSHVLLGQMSSSNLPSLYHRRLSLEEPYSSGFGV
jgi:hypothetical protein